MVDFNEQSSGRPGVHLEGPAAILRTFSQTKPPRQPAIRLQLQLCFLAVCIALIWSILPYPPNIGTSSNIEIGKNIPPEIAETIRGCEGAEPGGPSSSRSYLNCWLLY